MRSRAAVLAALGALASCGVDRQPVPATDLAQAGTIEVVDDDVSRETRYTITSGDCRITWTVFKTAVNAGVVRHRAVCPLGLAEQAPMIGKLLDKVGPFRTLMWGRLYPDDAREATMAARLAIAASRSDQWDAVTGRPKAGDLNSWVRKTLEASKVYEELKSVFAARGLEIRLASLEKVLVQQAGKLDFFAELSGAGVGVADKVPFDCQTWFSVKSGR